MIGSAARSRSLVKAQKQSSKVFRYPAPLGGIDVRRSIGEGDLNTCVYTYNLSPFEAGMRVRKGFREWQETLSDGSSINTMIPFTSSSSDALTNQLFAVTREGIWDTTDYNATPVLKLAFSDTNVKAGYGTYAHYITDAGVDILFYADSRNGLFQYDPGTDVWAIATGITGPVISNIRFIVVHKTRIWLIEESSTTAWYLGVGSITGAATAFYFGSKFKHGGALQGLFNWTVDGGAGVDDIFVAVSKAGDVVIYEGSDPTTSDWRLRGNYFIGEVPNTPRFGSEQGGELYLLSSFGVISMNDLLQGVDTNVLRAGADASSISLKIAGLLRTYMQESLNLEGWNVATIPSEGGLLISVPAVGSAARIQFYYNLATASWGLWRGLPLNSFTEFQDSVFFGSTDGRVCSMDVGVDNLLLAPIDPLANGDPIHFSILTSYSSLDSPAIYKRPKLVRPDFLATLKPTHSTQVRYDFDVNEAIDFQLNAGDARASGTWDNGTWDLAVWGSDAPSSFPTIGGTWGYGRYLAIATVGESRTDTRLIGWDLIYDVGGPML
jgi:hypothetical protein